MPPPTGPECFCVVRLFRLLIQSAAGIFSVLCPDVDSDMRMKRLEFRGQRSEAFFLLLNLGIAKIIQCWGGQRSLVLQPRV